MQITLHWTDAVLAAALDPSGGGAIGAAARAHATECPACGAALANAQAAEAAVARVLLTLDDPMTPVDMQQIVARAARSQGQNGGTQHPLRSARQRQGVPFRPRVGWGIGLLVSAATVAAAAVPGSPVHQWMMHLLRHETPARTITAQPQDNRGVQEGSLATRSVAIVPRGTMSVVFQAPQRIGVIRINTKATDQLIVRGSGNGAAYTVGENVIHVDQHTNPTLNYDVELPAATTSADVYVRVGERLVYAREGGHVSTIGTPTTAGEYVIPFAQIAR